MSSRISFLRFDHYFFVLEFYTIYIIFYKAQLIISQTDRLKIKIYYIKGNNELSIVQSIQCTVLCTDND